MSPNEFFGGRWSVHVKIIIPHQIFSQFPTAFVCFIYIYIYFFLLLFVIFNFQHFCLDSLVPPYLKNSGNTPGSPCLVGREVNNREEYIILATGYNKCVNLIPYLHQTTLNSGYIVPVRRKKYLLYLYSNQADTHCLIFYIWLVL